MKVRRIEPLIAHDDWKALPIIVTAPGEYITRDGRRVTVRRVSGSATFCVQGSIWVEFRGKLRPHRNETWHPNGRVDLIAAGRERDIVGPFVKPVEIDEQREAA